MSTALKLFSLGLRLNEGDEAQVYVYESYEDTRAPPLGVVFLGLAPAHKMGGSGRGRLDVKGAFGAPQAALQNNARNVREPSSTARIRPVTHSTRPTTPEWAP